MNRFLSDASRIATNGGHTAAALDRVARTTVPAFADLCLVYIAHGEQLRCMAYAHRTRAGHRLLQALTRVYRITRSDPESTVAQVVRLGRPSLRAIIRPESRSLSGAVTSSPRVLALHQQLAVRSALVMPIEGSTGVLGALVLCYAESDRRYSAADVIRARKIAAHMTLLVQHAPLLTLVARQERMLSRMLGRSASAPPTVLRASRPRARS